MIYKNTAVVTKTFYGVTFKPGDIKEVPGPIHHPKFVRLTAMPDVAKPVSSTPSKGSAKTSGTTNTSGKKSDVNVPSVEPAPDKNK